MTGISSVTPGSQDNPAIQQLLAKMEADQAARAEQRRIDDEKRRIEDEKRRMEDEKRRAEENERRRVEDEKHAETMRQELLRVSASIGLQPLGFRQPQFDSPATSRIPLARANGARGRSPSRTDRMPINPALDISFQPLQAQGRTPSTLAAGTGLQQVSGAQDSFDARIRQRNEVLRNQPVPPTTNYPQRKELDYVKVGLYPKAETYKLWLNDLVDAVATTCGDVDLGTYWVTRVLCAESHAELHDVGGLGTLDNKLRTALNKIIPLDMKNELEILERKYEEKFEKVRGR